MWLVCLAVLLGVTAAIWPVYAEASEIVHVVAKGQNLGAIAKRYHTTVAAIREVNGLRPGQRIKPGLVLIIPEKGKIAEAKKAAEQRAKSQQAARKAAQGKKKGDAKGAGGGKADPLVFAPKRKGFVHLVRGAEKLDVQLITRQGRLVPAALPGLSRMMKHVPSDSKTSIDPRLATLVGMVSDHFGGRPIHIVSGYRPYSPTQFTRDSNHNHGRALDFHIPGVPNTVLRDFCRTFRNAGVGYYPNSSFVHLDVRSTKAYWIDHSRPGEPPKYDASVGQGSADETTGDVDQAPREGQAPAKNVTTDTPPPAPAGEGGSSGTHPPPSQPIDSSNGKSGARDSTAKDRSEEGQ